MEYNGETTRDNFDGSAKAFYNGIGWVEFDVTDRDTGEAVGFAGPFFMEIYKADPKSFVPGQWALPGNARVSEFILRPDFLSQVGYIPAGATDEEKMDAARRGLNSTALRLFFYTMKGMGPEYDAGTVDDKFILNYISGGHLNGEALPEYINMSAEDHAAAILSEPVRITDIPADEVSVPFGVFTREGPCRIVAFSYLGRSTYEGEPVMYHSKGKYSSFVYDGDMANCIEEYVPSPAMVPGAEALDKAVTLSGVNGDYRISFEDPSFKGTYEVFNMSGQMVKSGALVNGAAFQLNAAGMYIVRITVDGKGVIAKKAVKI
jgi:hypothetical protein